METSGKQLHDYSTQKGCQKPETQYIQSNADVALWHPFWVRSYGIAIRGYRRRSSTLGYSLPTLRVGRGNASLQLLTRQANVKCNNVPPQSRLLRRPLTHWWIDESTLTDRFPLLCPLPYCAAFELL